MPVWTCNSGGTIEESVVAFMLNEFLGRVACFLCMRETQKAKFSSTTRKTNSNRSPIRRVARAPGSLSTSDGVRSTKHGTPESTPTSSVAWWLVTTSCDAYVCPLPAPRGPRRDPRRVLVTEGRLLVWSQIGLDLDVEPLARVWGGG